MPSGLYLGFEYLDGYYGLFADDLLKPLDVQFYRTTVDNNYVFHWILPEQAYVPGLKKLIYELQIDTVDTFNSTDLQTFGLNIQSTLLVSDTQADVFSSATVGSTALSMVANTFVGKVVEITSGTGIGQLRRILSNTSTTLTVEFDWSTDPDGSSEFRVYESNVANFQNGNVAKGYQVVVPSRTANPDQGYFARVRTLATTVPASEYSAVIQFSLLGRFDLVAAENMVNNLPDYHVYNKDVIKLPEAQRNTLVWKLMLMYGKEFDRGTLLKELVKTDNYLTLTRDELLFYNFGTYFDFIKPTDMQYVDYRRCLQQLVDASMEGSTEEALIDVIQSLTGVGPTIDTIRDILDFFLVTIRERFACTGSTNTYILTESASFITSSLMVVRQGATTDVLLTPQVDFFPDESLPGFTTIISYPSGNTLTAFYDIDSPGPAVFDSNDIYAESAGFPPTCWDRRTAAFGLRVAVNNPAEFTLDTGLLERLARLILPAHVKVLFTYP